MRCSVSCAVSGYALLTSTSRELSVLLRSTLCILVGFAHAGLERPEGRQEGDAPGHCVLAHDCSKGWPLSFFCSCWCTRAQVLRPLPQSLLQIGEITARMNKACHDQASELF